VRSVWIAPRAAARTRYLLTRAGDGQYQVNLADRMLSAILAAWEGEREFRVFAETAAGTVVDSIGVRYAVSPKPAGKPPRIFVHAGGKRREIIRRLPDGIFEDLAMRAHFSGSDLWVFPTGWAVPFLTAAYENEETRLRLAVLGRARLGV
jgi:hypothetical protein